MLQQDRISLNQHISDRSLAYQWILVFTILVAFGIYLWSVQKDLPFTPNIDEPLFVLPAIRMAASGDLNPGWFGNPGSTVIYPLALIYYLWTWTNLPDSGLPPDDVELPTEYDLLLSEFFWLGRFMTVGFALISLPLVYQLGRQSFTRQVGLIGAIFSALPLVVVSHAQSIRTDSAATFFGLVALYFCLKLVKQPGLGNQLKAGLTIGLAIATRYFMVTLVPVLLAVDLIILRRQWTMPEGKKSKALLAIGCGLLLIVAGFALATPYFFLDLSTVIADLRLEARTSQIGADGLTPPQNFWWYLTQAIPDIFTWPLAALVGVGVILVLYERRVQQMLLLGFAGIFLVGIGLSALHWQRWIIQIVPVLALFAANALSQIGAELARQWQLRPLARQVLIVLLVVLCSAWPMQRLITFTMREANPSTRVLAREWVLQHLPAGSKIAQEEYTAALDGTDYVIFKIFSLATSGHTLEEAYQDGFRYIMVSEGIYGRYLAEPERYPAEVKLYQSLFEQGKLLQQFEPSATRPGPTIKIFELVAPE